MWGTGNLSAPCKGLVLNSNVHAMSWVQPWQSNRCFLMANVPNLWLGRKFHTSVLRAKNWNVDMHQKWFNSLKLLSKHCSHGLHQESRPPRSCYTWILQSILTFKYWHFWPVYFPFSTVNWKMKHLAMFQARDPYVFPCWAATDTLQHF